MKRFLTILLTLTMSTMGCYKRVAIPLEDLREGASFSAKPKQTYRVKSANENEPRKFTAFRVEKGQVVSESSEFLGGKTTPLPVQDVQSVETSQFSGGRTLLGIVGASAVFVLFFILGIGTLGSPSS